MHNGHKSPIKKKSLWILAFGASFFLACENSSLVSKRSAGNAQNEEGEADDELENVDEAFQLDLHRGQVERGVARGQRTCNEAKKQCPLNCTPVPPAPPKMEAGQPGEGLGKMTVRQVIDLAVYACSKTPDQIRALVKLGESMSKEQLDTLNIFDRRLGGEVSAIVSVTKLVGVDRIIELQKAFCQNASPVVVPTPPPAAVGTATQTNTGTSTGTVQASGKQSAPLNGGKGGNP